MLLRRSFGLSSLGMVEGSDRYAIFVKFVGFKFLSSLTMIFRTMRPFRLRQRSVRILQLLLSMNFLTNHIQAEFVVFVCEVFDRGCHLYVNQTLLVKIVDYRNNI